MLEETSKQLLESLESQKQLANKLEFNEKQAADLVGKQLSSAQEYEERLDELRKKIANYEGLTDIYELEINNKKQLIAELKNNLLETNAKLNTAHSQLESDKSELSTLENARRELQEQRSFLTRDLTDQSQIKGKLIKKKLA
jgi:capsule polysaccharide export protein KpsE/RkpR